MEFSRQVYWSGLPFPPPGDLPNPGTESASPMSPALAGRFFLPESPRNSPKCLRRYSYLFSISNVSMHWSVLTVSLFLPTLTIFTFSLAPAFNTCWDCLFNCQESPPNCQIPLDPSAVSDRCQCDCLEMLFLSIAFLGWYSFLTNWNNCVWSQTVFK